MIELLVGIAIVAILAGVSLPAIQSVRESARTTVCRNHIRQLAQGMLQHETKMGRLPAGGWSPIWLGIAEREGGRQPGGWTYSILPYIEELPLYHVVETATAATAQQAYETLATSPAAIFSCPTRRTTRPRPVPAGGRFLAAESAALSFASATRSDYAANGGARGVCPPTTTLKGKTGSSNNPKKVLIGHYPGGKETKCVEVDVAWSAFIGEGHMNHALDTLGGCADQSCLAPIDFSIYNPKDLPDGDAWAAATIPQRTALPDNARPDLQDGIVTRMAEIPLARIEDGLSNTYLLGEKYVDAAEYLSGLDPGDASILYAGYSSSNVRWAIDLPAADESGISRPNAFGSGHAGGWNVAFADGRIQTIGFDISPELHSGLAGRANGVGDMVLQSSSGNGNGRK